MKTTKEILKNIIDEEDYSKIEASANSLLKMTVEELQANYNIKNDSALKIYSYIEFYKEFSKTLLTEVNQINEPIKLYNLMKPHLMGLDHEEMWVVYLSNSLDVIKKIKISMGGIGSSIYDVRLIIKHGILCNSTSIAIIHNHPGGSLIASDADIQMTKDVAAACKLMQMQLIDSMIFTDTGYSNIPIPV
ncbi:MAG: JAB domain-containing protein [Ignavibacteria bacterium]